MTEEKKPKSNTERQATYRQKKKDDGLVPVTVYVHIKDKDDLVKIANDMLERRKPK